MADINTLGAPPRPADTRPLSTAAETTATAAAAPTADPAAAAPAEPAPVDTYVADGPDPEAAAQQNLRKMARQHGGRSAEKTAVEQPQHAHHKAPVASPAERNVVRAADQASRLLDEGKGADAAKLLTAEAEKARQAAAHLDPKGAQARTLTTSAENFDARAKAYGATNPQDSMRAARDLDAAGARSEQLAQELERAGKHEEAKLARAVGQDSRIQANTVAESSVNSDVLMGTAISKSYRDIVDKSLDAKIDDYGSIHNMITGGRDKLTADKKKMGVVFDELDRTMKTRGVSFDRAWNDMFDDNKMTFQGPLKDAGFVSRNDAAAFLRDHPETRGLLAPFADVARGISTGDAKTAERGQGQIIESLRSHGQWNIAHSVLDGYKQSAATAEGKAEAGRLAGNEGGEKFKAKAADFIARDVPVLLLTGVLSGGVGTLARGGAMAVGWGATAVRATQVAAELGAFVPTERVLNDAINGKKADWSAGALTRDYALTVGGYGMFKALGKGWQAIRGASGEIAGEAAGEAASKLVPKNPPIGAKDLVLDSNVAIALRKRANQEVLNEGEKALLKTMDAMPGHRYRVSPTTSGEVRGASHMEFELTAERSSKEYTDLKEVLDQFNVGKAKGQADRAIVADTFFAQTENGTVPTLVTHDKGIYNRLLLISGKNPEKLGKSVLEAFPQGFEVTINGRTIRVRPV